MAKFYRSAFGWQTRLLGEEMGSYVSFLDPEGNRVSMLEPIPMNWHGPVTKPTPKMAAKKSGTKR